MLTCQAFIALLNLHILFSPRSNAPAAKAAPLEMADEMQHKLGGAFMAAVERYGEHLELGNQAGTSQARTCWHSPLHGKCATHPLQLIPQTTKTRLASINSSPS
jgi:hypothetical protein